jgi:hypothetical protein
MQTQVVHQGKASIPWLPALIAALLVAGIVVTAQLAIDRPGTTAPAVAVAPGTTTLSGVTASTVGAPKTSGPHPRTKFGGSTRGGSVGSHDPALQALITRIQLQRKANTLP